MKDRFILILLFIAFCGCIAHAQESTLIDVDVETAYNLIKSHPDLIILDVRTPSEFDSGHIEGARLIPVDELPSRISELDRNREILVYCRTGHRSLQASNILIENGFKKVYNMLGGVTSWTEAGYTLTAPSPTSTPGFELGIAAGVIAILALRRKR